VTIVRVRIAISNYYFWALHINVNKLFLTLFISSHCYYDVSPGQNKNNTVIRLAPYLVEMGYFQRVSVVFFVAGHTKNYADRRFNDMKHDYHTQNLYAMTQLVEVCGRSPYVKTHAVSHEDFFNYDKFLNTLYKRFPAGGVLKYQLFTATKDDKCKVVCRVANLEDSDEVTRIMRKGATKNKKVSEYVTIDGEQVKRSEALKTLRPDQLYKEAPGLTTRKRGEMFTKWRPYIDRNFRNITCPKPPPEIFAMVKAEIRKKKEEMIKRSKH